MLLEVTFVSEQLEVQMNMICIDNGVLPSKLLHMNADLSEVSGSHADLSEVSGSHADPSEVSGSHADLSEVSGSHADPSEVSGSQADPSEVSGSHADPSEVSGSHADLSALLVTRRIQEFNVFTCQYYFVCSGSVSLMCSAVLCRTFIFMSYFLHFFKVIYYTT